ncbi:patatin-like phospholipase family protein [Caulobacter mirabilis]|uniref:patatin-like phospholipase family protein n=1 Tax=Caulobacter mirabilis TaxID=69666 RepID=UPI001FE9E43D|nr:patatin-like phospholipase family protein [Caulobacter mirabilis]
MKPRPIEPRPISLGLQGGGSHGAFEWGVIDRLLDEKKLEIGAVTAASAGAMNGACLISGLAAGGRQGAQETLAAFWRGVSNSDGRNGTVFGDSSVWTSMLTPDWLRETPAWRWAESLTGALSPYEFNPFNLNPLREVLEKTVDFEAVRRSPVKLYVSATGVRTGKAKIFKGESLTVEHLLASACLPTLFHAVEIDGEPYWDGGYLANPPLWPLFYADTPNDLLIVALNPFIREDLPKTPSEIMDRLNEITFNAALSAELRAVAFVQKLLDDGLLKENARGRYRRMFVHAIGADGRLSDLTMATKFKTDWSFLTDLRERGRQAADDWLAKNLKSVGVQSSVDLKAEFL